MCFPKRHLAFGSLIRGRGGNLQNSGTPKNHQFSLERPESDGFGPDPPGSDKIRAGLSEIRAEAGRSFFVCFGRADATDARLMRRARPSKWSSGQEVGLKPKIENWAALPGSKPGGGFLLVDWRFYCILTVI